MIHDDDGDDHSLRTSEDRHQSAECRSSDNDKETDMARRGRETSREGRGCDALIRQKENKREKEKEPDFVVTCTLKKKVPGFGYQVFHSFLVSDFASHPPSCCSCLLLISDGRQDYKERERLQKGREGENRKRTGVNGGWDLRGCK